MSPPMQCLSPLQARTTCLLWPRVHILGRYKQTLPGHHDCVSDLCQDGDYVVVVDGHGGGDKNKDDDCVTVTKPGV